MYDLPIQPCGRCSGIDVVSDTSSGDIVCRSCGEIQASRIIDYSAEWREFAEDNRGTNGSSARSSLTADKFGSSGTEFSGGVSESARAALVKAQMQVTDKRELKIGRTAILISNIGSTLHLTRRIMVSAIMI